MRYGKTDVLTGVSFAARRGEVLALLGPNGAGKTTTIEILEGFRMRSAGQVSVLGVDPAHGDEAWRARTRRRAAVLARPREMAGPRAARAPGPLLRAVLHAERHAAPGTWTTCIETVGLTAHARKRVR